MFEITPWYNMLLFFFSHKSNYYRYTNILRMRCLQERSKYSILTVYNWHFDEIRIRTLVIYTILNSNLLKAENIYYGSGYSSISNFKSVNSTNLLYSLSILKVISPDTGTEVCHDFSNNSGLSSSISSISIS